MKKTIFSLVVAFVLLMTTYSCNKPGNTNSEPTIPIDADLQAAFYYKVGTYWIYRDSISGRVDSFAVRSTKPTTMNIAGNAILDGISINITEYNGGSTTDTSAWIINLASNYIELLWFKSLTGLGYFDFLPLVDYPFSMGSLTASDASGGSDNTEYPIQVFMSFDLRNKIFNNVEETFHQNKYINTINYDDYIYINDNEGIIKMDINDHYNNIFFAWELINWQIVK